MCGGMCGSRAICAGVCVGVGQYVRGCVGWFNGRMGLCGSARVLGCEGMCERYEGMCGPLPLWLECRVFR